MFAPAKSLDEVNSPVLWKMQLSKKEQEINLLQMEIRILKETIQLMAGTRKVSID